jgi:hypothetical protein
LDYPILRVGHCLSVFTHVDKKWEDNMLEN